MLKLNFTLSELCIDSSARLTLEQADKLLRHIQIMQPIRLELGQPIYVSKHSGYRPIAWEYAHGRSGTSEHCFIGDGAVDWTCDKHYIEDLYFLLQSSAYTRVCMYPNNNFLHTDLLPASSSTQLYTCASPTSKWERVG
jgi:hypothetical protein